MNKIKVYLFKQIGDLSAIFGKNHFVSETLYQCEIELIFIWLKNGFRIILL